MRKAVKTTKKTAVEPAAEVKEVAVKAAKAAKTASKVVEEKAGAAVKEAVKKAAEVTEGVKAEAKKAAKAPAKKTDVKEEVFLQYQGKEINKDELLKAVKEIWTKQLKNKVGDMKTVSLYLKPEENMAYYVINGDVTGSIEL